MTGTTFISTTGSINRHERHGDWSLSVNTTVARHPERHCAISYEHFDLDTRKRVLSIELYPENGNLRGTLVLPAGLCLKSGVMLQCDETAPGPVQPFATALPLGCLIDVHLDGAMIASLRQTSRIHVRATDADTGREKIFTVSLNGFSAVLDRAFSIIDPFATKAKIRRALRFH